MEFNGYAAGTNATVAQDCLAREPQVLAYESPKPRMREITISPLDYGFVVRVGCQTVAIQNKSELIAKLVEYINDPWGTEERYNRGELFK